MRPSATRLLSRTLAPVAFAGLLTLVGGLATSAAAQTKAASPTIYTCSTPDGRRLTSDRPIPECQSREQRVLNSDGSVRRMLPPAMSPEERLKTESKILEIVEERLRMAIAEEMKRKQNTLLGFNASAAAILSAQEVTAA